MPNPRQRVLFILCEYSSSFFSSTKHLEAFVWLIKMQKGSQETRGMLFFRQEHIQKEQRLDIIVYCCWTCLGKKEERDRKTGQKERDSRERDRKKQERQEGVVSYSLCLWSQNKQAAAAKHVYKLVYMSKTAQKRKNSQTRPETLNPCRARRYLVFNGSKPLSIAHDTFHRI